ncbi:MAG: hypothetical protein LBF91_04830 [Azoarcus sp.]|jgi:cell wall-associated NlpC family hydrolase|nr:hypothetical protein [Azoarcus sp.]
MTVPWLRRRAASRFLVSSWWWFGLVLAAVGAGLVANAARAPGAAIALPAGLVSRLEAGDLVFRIGSGWQSQVARGAGRAGRGDPYSHVGMLVGSPARWEVLHAVPAEAPGRADAVVRDDLGFFLAPERARGIAIYRVAADAATRAAAVDYALRRLGTPFRIVENDREGQYCTTLVWRAWLRAGVDLGARFEHLDIPLAAGDYLLPHSLRAAPGLRLLFETPMGR